MKHSWRMQWYEPGNHAVGGYYTATIYGATYQEAIEEYARKYWTAEDRKLIGKVTLFALEGQEVAL